MIYFSDNFLSWICLGYVHAILADFALKTIKNAATISLLL